MIELDGLGQPRDLRDLDAETLRDVAAHAAVEHRRSARRHLRIALQWARLHPAAPGDEATWGEVVREGWDLVVGAEGCPSVKSGCLAELGAVLGVSTFSATLLVEDALDLAFRLPRLWAAVEALEMDAARRGGSRGSPTTSEPRPRRSSTPPWAVGWPG